MTASYAVRVLLYDRTVVNRSKFYASVARLLLAVGCNVL